MLKQAFISILQNVDNNSDLHRAVKKVVMKTLGERDYAVEETVHHLLSLKLHSLCRLQESLTEVDYILIDEYSILGQVAFGRIDKRCKQATGFDNKVL